jgi:hypothetical protein
MPSAIPITSASEVAIASPVPSRRRLAFVSVQKRSSPVRVSSVRAIVDQASAMAAGGGISLSPGLAASRMLEPTR